MSEQSPSRSKIALYFIFAIAVSVICGTSLSFTAVMFFDVDPGAGFSLKVALIGLILAILQYGSGAFVLGTLTHGHVKTWTSAVIYVIPSFLFRGFIFVSAAVSEVMKEDMLANVGTMIVMPIIYLIISPFASFYFIRLGEGSAKDFSRENAILNIPWQHWLWIFPFYLFQVIGVPSYLLLALWRIDLLTADVPLSIFSLPTLIPRIVVFAILAGIIMSINSVYCTLSKQHGGPRGVKMLKVFGNWLLLTAIQAFIVLTYVGKHMD